MYSHTSLCVGMFLFLLGRYLKEELLGHIINLTFSKKLSNCFPEWLCHFIVPSALCEGSGFYILENT